MVGQRAGQWSRREEVERLSPRQRGAPKVAIMFIRYFIEIPQPMAEVESELLDSPGRWLTGPAQDAEVRGSQLLADVGFGPAHARVDKQVEIQFGAPLRFR